jgi:decaprenylphospho-beta-D-erythro-pentofuranosid-2-ulose 2-reductase
MNGNAPRVLLVGGSSEIGLSIVRRLVGHSGKAEVTLAGRPSAQLVAAEAELGQDGHRIHVLSYDAQWGATATADLLTEARRRMGGLNLVVVAVGSLGDARVPDEFGPSSPAEPDLEALLVANLVGPALVANAAVDLFAGQRHGTLVVISSVAAVRSRLPILAYSAAKHGLDELVRGLAARARPYGVECLVIRPGRVRTRMSADSAPVPLTVDPDTVAVHVQRALGRGRTVAWSPPLLGPLTSAVRLVPTALLPKDLR